MYGNTETGNGGRGVKADVSAVDLCRVRGVTVRSVLLVGRGYLYRELRSVWKHPS